MRAAFTYCLVIAAAGVLWWSIPRQRRSHSDFPTIPAAKAQISAFTICLKVYESDNHHCPSTVDGLHALLQKPTGETNWRGPYLDGDAVPKDSWGRDYIYECPGKHTNAFDLLSLGPDGRRGTEDDIVNWKK